MSSATSSNGNGNGNAPTEPLQQTPPATPDPRQRRRQQLLQGSRGQRLPRWRGRMRTRQQSQRRRFAPGGQRPSRLTFRGQEPGETAIFVRHKHIIMLILPALPAVIAAIGLLVLVVLRMRTTDARLSALYFILAVILAVIFIIALVKWLTVDLISWIFNVYVLTDRRILRSEGFINRKRQEAQLDRIQQVQLDRHSVFEYLFDIGDVDIVTAGTQGNIAFEGVWHPAQMSDQIRDAEQRFYGGSKAAVAPVEPKHPAVKKVLDELAKPAAVSAAQPAGPVGRPLRRAASVDYLDGEAIVQYIHRHWIRLATGWAFPAVIIIVSLAASGTLAAFFHTALWVIPLAGVLVGLVWGAAVYFNYIDDVFILTTHRIIDIDRLLFIFFEGRKQADYSKVQDVRVAQTLVGRLLDFGDIVVETAGRLPNIEMIQIPHPFVVQDKILGAQNAVRERDAAAAANRQRLEYRRLIASTMNELLVEVPDVRQLFFLDAAEQLRKVGLKAVVESERRALGVPPGVVISQSPGAGTTALSESEVQVVLSGR